MMGQALDRFSERILDPPVSLLVSVNIKFQALA
jgi:hypothetical protein